MPELPEVEVTRRRLEPELVGKKITSVIVRVAKLRSPVPENLAEILSGLTLHAIIRRGKYLLFDCGSGWLLIHLGMTGFLRLLHGSSPPGPHDHFDFIFDDGSLLRFHDPRKFGIVTWFTGDPFLHPLLADIGPEPLTASFNGDYLFGISRGRKVAIKQFIMNSEIVAGVGNIYANEALFRAGILPDRTAGSLTLTECAEIAAQIHEVLEQSVNAGSSFRITGESVAYHPFDFDVYGRGGKPCRRCSTPLEEIRISNRSTVFCRSCQK
jgi:formamidopyrimidine-DNA glycosylase